MNDIISPVEIALIIILPLIIFYQRRKYKPIIYFRNVAILYLIWFLTYGLMHELCHMIGIWLVGVEVLDYQLMPHFWEGDTHTGHVNAKYDNGFQLFITVLIPYLRDFILLVVGLIILNKYKIKNALVEGLIIVIFFLSPLYDVVNNYFAFVFGYHNDFTGVKNYLGNFGVHAFGNSLTVFAMITSYYFLFKKKVNDEHTG